MIPSERLSTGPDDDIDVFAVFGVLWRYRYFIAGVVFVCALAAAIYALNAPVKFRADVIVTEVTDRTSGAASSLTSQLGGLASIAGINLLQRGTGRESRAVLQSRRLVEEFVVRNKLLDTLFPEAQEKPPTLWRAVRKFQQGVLEIREDTRKGTVTVSVEWSDPAIAAQWANGFVALANEIIRTRAQEESRRNIDYLNQQIAQTKVIELQRMMYNLIEGETKTLMVANGRAEYAFTVVDPAVAPEIRSKPRRTVIVLIGAVLGTFIASILAVLHNMMRQRKRGVVAAAIRV